MPSRVARMRLAQAVGSQFDTTVVAAFEAILATADESYRLAHRADFDFSLRHAEAEPSRPLRSWMSLSRDSVVSLGVRRRPAT